MNFWLLPYTYDNVCYESANLRYIQPFHPYKRIGIATCFWIYLLRY